MRRMNGFVTFLLVILSVAGIGLAAVFLKHENQLATQRQQKMAQLNEQLQPINAQRKELQEKDKTWQKSLEEEKKGKPCVVLCFNTMEEEVYATMYDMMEQYGFRGTFALKDGHVPGYSDDAVTGSEVSEMLDDGWEYALAEDLNAGKTTDDELSFLNEAETETGTDQEEAEESSEEGSNASFREQLDAHISTLDEYQMSRPQTIFCTQQQYDQLSTADLTEKGIQAVCILNEAEFPILEESEEDNVRVLQAGVYTQQDMKVEETLTNAINNNKSMVICMNSVKKISEDAGYDLSITKFTSLLTTLKNLEDQGEIYVLTFSELLQYEDQKDQSYEKLASQYAKFKEEMNQKLKELNQQEQQAVDALDSNETEESGIWKYL